MESLSSTTRKIEKTVEELVAELETLGREVELKMSLASMEARDVWQKSLEPRLYEAKLHARDFGEASSRRVHETLEAVREFAKKL